jgi:imidazoleglycerol phosphate dehydratase HisB
MTDPIAARAASILRTTRETNVRVSLDLDRPGDPRVRSGIGFLDHLLATFAFHAQFGLDLSAEGDLDVDDHHTAEDCGIALGEALDAALGRRLGLVRFGEAHAPLEDGLARAVIDLARRPWATVKLGLRREMLGTLAAENVAHTVRSLAMAGRLTLHLDVLRGDNDHHRAEAAFKALAIALRGASRRECRSDSQTDAPLTAMANSLKGTL